MIRHRHARALYIGVAAAALFSSPAFAQDAPATQPVADTQANADQSNDIVIVARPCPKKSSLTSVSPSSL